jgi:hypothetical protein
MFKTRIESLEFDNLICTVYSHYVKEKIYESYMLGRLLNKVTCIVHDSEYMKTEC